MKKFSLVFHYYSVPLLFLQVLLCLNLAFASNPPHERVKTMIKSGIIPRPYFLEHISEGREKGLNMPWRETLEKQQGIHLERKGLSKINKRAKGQSINTTTSYKALVILVKFSDKNSSVAASSFDGIAFGTTGNTLRTYYSAISGGTLDIVTVNLPSSVGWQQMPQTYSYYVNGQNGTGSYPQNAQKLAEDAVFAVDGVVDFSQYDNDGDDYVDALMIVHAGRGAEFSGSSNDIWSHSWNMQSPRLHDGVYTYAYTTEPEYWQNAGDMTCGVYAHEFGHMVFDLPDLYDTDVSPAVESEGIGNWSLMAGGSWNGPSGLGGSPALPDAWSRIQMGYATAVNITSNTIGQQIQSAQSSTTVYRLWKFGTSGSQYFLVENRQQTGFDSYLPGNGLLVYHVDDNVYSNNGEWYPGHTTYGHYHVALEQADGSYNMEKNQNRGDAGDPFPGSGNKRLFNLSSSPNSKDYSGTNTFVDVSNISNSGTTMTADFKIGKYRLRLWSATYIEAGSGGYYTLNGINIGTSYNNLITEEQTNMIDAISPSGYVTLPKWNDGVSGHPRQVSVWGLTTSATYKGNHKSNTSTAFSNNGQRKFVQTITNGTRWLHQVYESGGRVWIEHSTDNGLTWILGNNGESLGAGKNPSISFSNANQWANNYIGVVWQQQSGPYGSRYSILGMLFNQIQGSNGVPQPDYPRTLFTEPADSWSTNANPNIIVHGFAYVVTFERKSTSGSLQPGINWLMGPFEDYGSQVFGLSGALNGVVAGTDAGSTNAALSLTYYSVGSTIDIDCIYQTASGLKYLWIDFWRDMNGNWIFSQQSPPSPIGYQAPVNINPSIVSFPNLEYGASWIEYDVLTYKYSASPVLYYYGSGAQSNSINRGGDNNGFVAWSQNNGGTWTNKSIRFQNYSPSGNTVQTLSTAGKYVQLANSVTSSLNNMYVSSFSPFTAPYPFNTSGQLGPLNKAGELIVGRGFAINRGDASFSYRFGDFNVDGVNIGFVDASDTLDYSNMEILNNVLVTKSFELKPNSKVIFTEGFGFSDPESAIQAFGKDGFVHYKVELIDNVTGKVVGTIRDISLTSVDARSYKTMSYSLNTKQLAGKTVRAKVTLATNVVDETPARPVVIVSGTKGSVRRKNLHSQLVLIKSFAEENQALTKSSLIELSIDVTEMPTTYALSQNYPNPFNPVTTINYQLPKDGLVTLKVYDVLGRDVMTLVNEYKTIGRYTATFNASELSSGLYIYRFVSQPADGGRKDIYTDVKKMLLVK